ncbi:MAG TPA: hypothetical protein VFC19_25635 [Candidatus Limnocylindrales bacterium]|nr:hypothetical protein [Candidatus Limnocylindrales bacterium]
MAESTGIAREAVGQLVQLSAQKWGIGLSVLLVAISGLFGGLDTAPERATAVNAAIDAGPWKVTITGARLTRELRPMHLMEEKNYFIVVLATVEIKADRTWKFLGETVQLAPTKGIVAKPTKSLSGDTFHRNDGIVLLRDVTKIDQLNPGMPEKLAYFWEFDSTVPIPSEVKVYIGFRKFREDSLSGHMSWMEHSELNKAVVVPLVDRRDATAGSS